MPPKLASLSSDLQMSFRANVRRTILSRPRRSWPVRRGSIAVAAALVPVLLGAGGAAPSWSEREQLPLARTEVAAARTALPARGLQ